MFLSPVAASTSTLGNPGVDVDSPSTPRDRRPTCLALKVPNNTPLSPPKSKKTRAAAKSPKKQQDAFTDVGLFMERIQALEEKQKKVDSP